MNNKISIFFLTNIIIGTIIAISSNHWFLIWIGLETNTISILPILLNNNNRRNIEASIKYFLIQALAAAIILNAALINIWNNGSWLIYSQINNISNINLTIALFFKLGISPFHFWFPEVINGISLVNGLILTTWQKIAPTIITININNNLNNNITIICTTLSIIIGSWNGINQTQTRKIMAFSSINHMGWIILISIFNQNISLIMLTIYIIINTAIFTNFIINNTTNISNINKNNITNPWNASTLSITILSLGGLPPLTGFINKFLSLYIIINNNNIILSLPLIIGSLISLFFYLRIVFNTNMTSFPQNSLTLINIRNNNNNNINTIINIISIIGLPLIPIFINIS
uniref:NADH dehydrogenase subunit 2 n=1 Tax=Zygometra comata TaxID=2797651 RepID=UPI0022FD5709|nr:NADH dehydrogenase subunit 2 [Zygometra comata]WAN81294.1 NADH dehydrogenase subunit 2 [Zygometra comata]